MAVGLLALAVGTAFNVGSASAATTAVSLGGASTFAVLAGSTVTNTGSSVISGDIGVSPGTAITGFPPGVQSTGTMNVANAAAGLAQTANTAAYLDAQGRTPATAIGSDLGGATLVAGVYKASSSLGLTGTLTLNGAGDSSSVFIIQVGSALTTASGSSVVLENGASACNVFWQVTSSATLGTNSQFVGTLLALTSATLTTGASVSGRVLAQTGAVTMDTNTISVPTCQASGGTTTTTSTSTTTTTTAASTTTTTTSASTTTTTSPASTTTVVPASTTTTTPIPAGSPSTGFGGAARSGSSPLGWLGLGAIALAVAAGVRGVRVRRTSPRSSTDATRS